MRSFPETVILEMSPSGSLARAITLESGTVSRLRELVPKELRSAEQTRAIRAKKKIVRKMFENFEDGFVVFGVTLFLGIIILYLVRRNICNWQILRLNYSNF